MSNKRDGRYAAGASSEKETEFQPRPFGRACLARPCARDAQERRMSLDGQYTEFKRQQMTAMSGSTRISGVVQIKVD